MSREYTLEDFTDRTGPGDSETAEETGFGTASDSGMSDPGEPPRGDESSGTDAEAGPGEATASEPDQPSRSVDPIRSTYSSSPEQTECARCGEPVSERWRQGTDLVCADCKDW